MLPASDSVFSAVDTVSPLNLKQIAQTGFLDAIDIFAPLCTCFGKSILIVSHFVLNRSHSEKTEGQGLQKQVI